MLSTPSSAAGAGPMRTMASTTDRKSAEMLNRAVRSWNAVLTTETPSSNANKEIASQSAARDSRTPPMTEAQSNAD